MKFDYCIGNPPYQEQRGGTKNVDIWPDFLFETTKICKTNCLIHPGRWIIPTKTFQKRHDKIIQDGLVAFNYYPNPNDVFHDVGVDGGISITLTKNGYTGDIKSYINGIDNGLYIENEKFFLNELEKEIYTKVFSDISTNMKDYVFGNIGALESTDPKQSEKLHLTPDKLKEPIKIWTSKTTGKGSAKYKWYYIEKVDLNNKYPDILF